MLRIRLFLCWRRSVSESIHVARRDHASGLRLRRSRRLAAGVRARGQGEAIGSRAVMPMHVPVFVIVLILLAYVFAVALLVAYVATFVAPRSGAMPARGRISGGATMPCCCGRLSHGCCRAPARSIRCADARRR